MSGGKPGVIRDPWRTTPRPAASPSTPAARKTPTETPLVDATHEDDIDVDSEGRKYSTIELKNYGGIVVEGTASTTQAAAQVLKFCVDNHKEIDRIFLDFGVVVTKLEPGYLQAPFYIQRSDGWTLAIPQATSRDQGCLQLIQALLRLKSNASLSRKLTEYRIKPYRV